MNLIDVNKERKIEMTHNEKLEFFTYEYHAQSPGFTENSKIYLKEIDTIIAGIESGFCFLMELGKAPNSELMDTIEAYYDLRKKYESITL
jgi:hypothetical protein